MALRYSPYYSTGPMVSHLPEPWLNQMDTPISDFRKPQSLTRQLKREKQTDPEELDVFRTLPHFLRNLWTMLNDTTLNDSIEWVGSVGTNTFAIKDTEKFVKKVIPKFFKHNKLSSFIRQLNLYQFVKVREKPNKASYRWKHTHLIRGNIHSLLNIRRKVPDDEKKGKVILDKLITKMNKQRRTILELKSRMKMIESEVIKGKELHITIKSQLNDAKVMLEAMLNQRPDEFNGQRSQKHFTKLPKKESAGHTFSSEGWLPKKTLKEQIFLSEPDWLKCSAPDVEKSMKGVVEELDPFALF